MRAWEWMLGIGIAMCVLADMFNMSRNFMELSIGIALMGFVGIFIAGSINHLGK